MALERLSGVGAASLVFVLALAIVLATVFVVYKMRQTDLRSYDLTTRAVRMYDISQPVKVDRARVPATTVGTDFSYSFWLYVASYEPSEFSRLVFLRGDPDDKDPNSVPYSPIVVLDRSSNSLHVLVRTNASNTTAPGKGGIDDIVADPVGRGWTLATIEYLPLQRWVNVAFSIKGAKVTVYLDGDTYTVESTAMLNGKPAARQAGVTSSLGVLPAATRGDVYVGMYPWPGVKPVQGSLTKLQFFNYAISKDEARAIYATGPMQATFTTRLGLPSYGVQTPVYRV